MIGHNELRSIAVAVIAFGIHYYMWLRTRTVRRDEDLDK